MTPGPPFAAVATWARSPATVGGPLTLEEDCVSYTGQVTVGGPADVRETPSLTITKVATPPFENNCYLLRCTATGATLLVDAAGDAPQLLALVGDGQLVGIVETHGHWDHVQALADVKAATNAAVLVHPGDAADLPVPADQLLADGDVITVGECHLSVIHLEGHTPGSVALLYEGDPERPHLFSGDSLFPGGPGRTAEPAQFTTLMDDLEGKVFGPLPDHTWVYPGHGSDTTLGVERPSLTQWRARGW
ncbi:MAG: MBL fold metallo-hydrolase [Frankiales bacterium]|nr:MBL fold metallo-hydrolase [Frankiales bacterium]